MQPAMAIQHEIELKQNLNDFGMVDAFKIANTLQGSVWKAFHKCSNHNVAIKATNKILHNESMIIVDGIKHTIYENVLSESQILKYLTCNSDADSNPSPESIVKYIDSHETKDNYFLVMEFGGISLFHFIQQIHHFVSNGNIEIQELHKAVKVIFNQMLECVEYIHSKNVCHFDISLENFVINDVKLLIAGNQVKFDCDNIQIKLCDFGLARLFDERESFMSDRFCGKRNYQSPEISNEEMFDARSNDIFCLGVCLWMMTTGCCPWDKSEKCDLSFRLIMSGKIRPLLMSWDRSCFVDDDLMNMFLSVFRYQENRCDIQSLKESKWLNK